MENSLRYKTLRMQKPTDWNVLLSELNVMVLLSTTSPDGIENWKTIMGTCINYSLCLVAFRNCLIKLTELLYRFDNFIKI